jgi:hypothetical protein
VVTAWNLGDKTSTVRTRRAVFSTDATLIVGLKLPIQFRAAGQFAWPMIGLWDDVSQRIGVIPTATGELSVYLARRFWAQRRVLES